MDFNILCVLEVDPISVGAISGRANADVAHGDTHTTIELEVGLWAI